MRGAGLRTPVLTSVVAFHLLLVRLPLSAIHVLTVRPLMPAAFRAAIDSLVLVQARIVGQVLRLVQQGQINLPAGQSG